MKPTRNQLKEILEYIIKIEEQEKALEKALVPFNDSRTMLKITGCVLQPIRVLFSKDLMYEIEYFLWDYAQVEVDGVIYDCSWRNIPAFLDYLEKFKYIKGNGDESKLNKKEAWASS